MKQSLLRELASRLSQFGATQLTISERFKALSRPEIAAVMSGNTSRFSLERILRLLRRCGCEINVDMTSAGRGGVVRWESLSGLGLGWLPLANTPGLTLIGGESEEVRRSVLAGYLREHVARGDRAVLYCQTPASGDIPTVTFNSDREVASLIGYHADVDLPQRERFIARVAGIDLIASSAAGPWTALHFAKSMRVYATVESLNGAREGQGAIDEFARLMGPPHNARGWQEAHRVIDTIVVPRACDSIRGPSPLYIATVAQAKSETHIVETLTDGQVEFDALVEKGLVHSMDFSSRTFHLKTTEDGLEFLKCLANRFDAEFSVTGPTVRSRKELEIEIRHHDTSAEVTIAASWSSAKQAYGIIFVTNDPEFAANGGIPVMSLGTAPIDIQYLVNRTTTYLRQFDGRAGAELIHA